MKPKLFCTSFNSQFSRDLDKNYKKDFDLYFLSRNKNCSKKNIFFYTSIKEISQIIKKIQPDIIWHNMAVSQQKKSFKLPLETFETNFFSTISIVEEIKKLKKKPLLVFFSSSSVYSQKINKKISEKDFLEPTSPYSFTKLYSEEYIKFTSEIYGYKYIIIRPFMVVSSYKKNGFIYELDKKIKNNIYKNETVIVGDLKKIKRDFIDVKVANIMIMNLIKKNAFNDTFNLCSSNEISLDEIFKFMISKYGIDIDYSVDNNLSNSFENDYRVGNNKKILKYCNYLDLNIRNYL